MAAFWTTIIGAAQSSATGIDLPFDPKAEFGSARARVIVTLNGHAYRTTTFTMGGRRFVPLRRSHREAAGVSAGQRVRVTITPDLRPRTVTPPPALAAALRAAGAMPGYRALCFTHQREHAEAVRDAKKPETQARRIDLCLRAALARAAAPAKPAPRKRSEQTPRPTKKKAGAPPKRGTGRVV